MSTPAPTIYLVAGATRGIGLALVNDIAAKDPTAIIYAGGRDPQSSSQLLEVAAKYPGRIELVKYAAGDREGNDAMAKTIDDAHGRVDTVIANAGINNRLAKIHETPPEKFEEHFSVNVIGPIVLFQSIRDLLKASSLPRFVPIGSSAGSLSLLGQSYAVDLVAYGTSKAALNWLTRKIHFENEWLVVFPICPGPVYTDMAKGAIAGDTTGVFETLKDIWRAPSVAAGMLVDIITASTREKDGGQFHNEIGGRHPW